MKVFFHMYICQQVGDNILKLCSIKCFSQYNPNNIFPNKFKLQYEYNTKCKLHKGSIVWQNFKKSWQSIHDLSHKFYNIYILDEMIFSIQLKQHVSPLKGFKFTTNVLTLILRCPKVQTFFFFGKLLACDKFNNFYHYFMQDKHLLIFHFYV
jgi:hypothetical protein